MWNALFAHFDWLVVDMVIVLVYGSCYGVGKNDMGQLGLGMHDNFACLHAIQVTISTMGTHRNRLHCCMIRKLYRFMLAASFPYF